MIQAHAREFKVIHGYDLGLSFYMLRSSTVD